MRVLNSLFFPLFLFASTFSFQVKSENYSDFMPISELFNKWKTFYSKSGNNYLYLNNEISLSYNKFGIFKSLFLFGKSNKDSVYLLYVLNSKSELQKGNYNIDIELKGYEREGVFFKYKFSNFKFRINFFKVLNHQNGFLQGSVIATENNKYTFNGFTDYYFSKNYLYHLWDYKKSYGYGYGIDFNYKYAFQNGYIKFNINDIGKMYIYNSPHSIVYINSSNKTEKNGYITYNPIISGKETYENIVLNSITKYQIEANYKKIIIGSKKINDLIIPYIGYKEKMFTFKYDFRFKSFGLKYKKRNFLFSCYTNNIILNKASSLGFNFSYYHSF
ncbi:hypothetical protein FE773_00280 [Caminibacter mediatlanticus TB-2]|uniref:Uncharacterized protein n=1 Tax=Caminibacter mediatlanticus TB-2 TaxID=391592 RepID=A0ABX5V6R9_9BACT|nr:hypothetical protein [Caminibacter mediatlanticus]QCT93679.1 hypothetical protein FE773_00280 [Caminibacter mediatlanticus TB-2]